MITPANCTVSVYRDTEVDDYADVVDDNTDPLYTGVPASIVEQQRRTTTQDQVTPRVVRSLVGRVSLGTDIRTNDRLVSEQTGAVYLVDGVSTNPGSALGVDALLDLRSTN